VAGPAREADTAARQPWREAYLRLIDVNRVEWRNRTHFLALAAQMMRRSLVESGRSRHRQKRGGDVVLVALDEAQDVGQQKGADVAALSDALTALAAVDLRMSRWWSSVSLVASVSTKRRIS